MASDNIAKACLRVWNELDAQGALKFMKVPLYTIVAGIALVRDSQVECISLGSGSKCLAQSQLAIVNGDTLHDSHAEVLARRGVIAWLLSEIIRMRAKSDFQSTWLQEYNTDRDEPRIRLRDDVTAHMYISALPCT